MHGRNGRIQRDTIRILKVDQGITIKEIERILGHNYLSIERALRGLKKRGLVTSDLDRLYNPKSHGQRLRFYLNDQITS